MWLRSYARSTKTEEEGPSRFWPVRSPSAAGKRRWSNQGFACTRERQWLASRWPEVARPCAPVVAQRLCLRGGPLQAALGDENHWGEGTWHDMVVEVPIEPCQDMLRRGMRATWSFDRRQWHCGLRVPVGASREGVASEGEAGSEPGRPPHRAEMRGGKGHIWEGRGMRQPGWGTVQA
jgi:hypothetical protein